MEFKKVFIYLTLGFGAPHQVIDFLKQAFSSFLPAFKLASFWLAVTHNQKVWRAGDQDFCGPICTLIDVIQR